MLEAVPFTRGMMNGAVRWALRAPATAGARGYWAQQVVAYFDAVAPEYVSRYTARSSAGEALRLRRDRVLKLLELPAGLVLDVGCGPGEAAQHLRAGGWRFWGVDLSHSMVAEAHRRNHSAPGAAFANARAEQLPFLDASFDAVLSMGVVEYTADDRQAVAEMVRVLRPRGVLVVTLAHGRSPYFVWKTIVYYPLVRLARACYCWLSHRPGPPVVYNSKRSYTEDWLVHNVPRGGILEEVVFCGFQVLPAPLDVLLPGIDIVLMRLFQRLERSPIRWLGTTLIAKVRRL
jgi:ubiquinone/menaquinone biosynthesis C-methylase UbiE